MSEQAKAERVTTVKDVIHQLREGGTSIRVDVDQWPAPEVQKLILEADQYGGLNLETMKQLRHKVAKAKGLTLPEVNAMSLGEFVAALCGPEPVVTLQGQEKPVIVFGKKLEKLSKKQYDVVKALLDAGETGLTESKLQENSKCEDARKTLGRIRAKGPEWREAIDMAGEPGRGYRIVHV